MLAAGMILLALPVCAAAGNDRLTEAQKIALIRGVVAEIGVAKQPLPGGKKGLDLAADGQILNQAEARQSVVNQGPAVRPGDRMQITKIEFQDRAIIFEVNGGPTRTHWYDHLSVGMGTATSPVAVARRSDGAVIRLRFAGGVPAGLTAPELKKLLAPIIEWNLRAAATAALSPALPPVVKKAIQDHQVLVGMTSDMVIAAKGRAAEKYHERDPNTGDEYDDWVYGHPPADTTFVRLEGDSVIRVIDYRADGTKVVRVTPEVNLPARAATASAADATPAPATDDTRPTLRRPGETPGANTGKAAAPGPILIPGAPPAAPTLPGASGQPQMPQPLPQPGTPGAPVPPGQPGQPGSSPPCCTL